MRTSFCAVFLLLLFLPSLCFAQMPVYPENLQGTWTGSNGRDTMTLQFMGNSCVFGFNGQVVNGMYQVQGNQLAMNLQNGKTISFYAVLEGNTLVLDGSVRLTRTAPMTPFPGNMPSSQPFSLDGLWSTQIPQGVLSFRFQGNQYQQLVNGQVLEAGTFMCHPDGTFIYSVTQGQAAGQQGQNRLIMNGPQSFIMQWPDGTQRSYVRSDGLSQGGPGFPEPQSPFEGRWIWAKQGPATFSYLFQGSQFIFYWNGMERSRGHFTFSNTQLIMRHEAGPDAGKQDVLGYQLRGNRLLIFTKPDLDPIPFVRN
ncbi:MAG: hypothetical protein IJU76_12880 [Desulfovibrionaceae bacterium]|nr:hypothetical protein [Desulfovibrionaceae bacterium]